MVFLILYSHLIHALPRGERRRMVRLATTKLTPFQSTLPRGERRNCRKYHFCYAHFNPRSHEGSDFKSQEEYDQDANFNPRSHEGSDNYRDVIALKSRNFNPRSHEGSDILRIGQLRDDNNFNPRSHEGSDVFQDSSS